MGGRGEALTRDETFHESYCKATEYKHETLGHAVTGFVDRDIGHFRIPPATLNGAFKTRKYSFREEKNSNVSAPDIRQDHNITRLNPGLQSGRSFPRSLAR